MLANLIVAKWKFFLHIENLFHILLLKEQSRLSRE